MSRSTIGAVLFDMGGTLEDVYYDSALRLAATPGLLRMLQDKGLDPGLPVPELYARVQAGLDAYGAWRTNTEQELPAGRIWSEYALVHPRLAPEQVETHGEDLALYYDLHFARRTLRPESRQVLQELAHRGFRLGVISNIYSRRAVPICLARYELAEYFETVVTSSAFGWRKPNERIFAEATRRMGLAPAECAYVGDTISRDVAGARRSGYGLVIQIKSFLTARADTDRDTAVPDAVIDELGKVLPIVDAHREETHVSD